MTGRPKPLPCLILILKAILLAAAPSGGPAAAQDVKGERELLYASNLGVNYKLVKVGKGIGAELQDNAEEDSPLGAIRLEKGDKITALDDQPIRTAQDVEAHFSRTAVTFVDVRTGITRRAMVDLPGQVVRPRFDRALIRQYAAEALRDGTIGYSRPRLDVDGDFVRFSPGGPQLGGVPMPVYDQFVVEIVRLTYPEAGWQRFWGPYLSRVEALIDEEVAAWNRGELVPNVRIDRIYTEAIEAYARSIGKKVPPETVVAPSKGLPPFNMVVLQTPGNRGVIYTMPKTKYLIRRLDALKRPIQLIEFDPVSPNVKCRLLGDFVYKIVLDDGRETPLRPLQIRDGGTFVLK